MARITDDRDEDDAETPNTNAHGIGREESPIPETEGTAKPTVKVLRLPAVCLMTGLARSTIYRMEADRQFPQRLKVGMRAVGWIEHEVQNWLANRIKDARSGTASST